MREELDREKMHKAIDSSFSGLNGDPWLFQRVSARAAEGEVHMKKKLSAGLALALVLVLLAAAAVAVTMLTHREIVEQVTVPMAVENDGETQGTNYVYSPEQLRIIVRTLNENGITFDENSDIMQYLRNGLGYYEDALFMRICEQAFGGDCEAWTAEQQDWYDEMQYRMGHIEEVQSHEPGETNMTYEEAETIALAKIREEYGKDLPLEDQSLWRVSYSFRKGSEGESEDHWVFTLWPKDIDHGYYTISFNDRSPHETNGQYAQIPDWTSYTGDELISAFEYLYGYQNSWSQAVWQQFHEKMLNAELKEESSWDAAYAGYRLTGYPEPETGEISREEAARIAKEALKMERAAFDSAVLTEYEGDRTWLVTFVIHDPPDGTSDEEAGQYIVSIDSLSGGVQSLRKFERFEDSPVMFYVAEGAYDTVREGVLKTKDMITLAVDAFREQFVQMGDPLDEKEFSIATRLNNEPYIEFKTRNPQHGGFTVWFNPDGTVDCITIDREATNGQNLFARYQQAYGYFSEWDQAKWVQLDADMRKLEPVTIESRLIKATQYPEEESVGIRHEEAQKLGIQMSGMRTAKVNTCVLVDAQPHPVWIMQVLAVGPTTVVGIDAETGKGVFAMKYNHSFTPNYVLYSLPETWRKMELEMKGAPYAAKAAVIDQYVPDDSYMLDYDYMEDGWNWDLEVDGLTVRYTGRWKGMKSYEVELDENGNVLRCEEKETEATEEKPEEEIFENPWIWGNASAPQGYWERLEKAMEKNEVYFGCLPDKMVVWTEEYGPFSTETWPKEQYAIGYVLTKIRPSEVNAGPAVYPEF